MINKKTKSFRIYSNLDDKLKQIVDKENNKRAYGKVTMTDIIERAIIRYIDYYDRWNK